jgi:NADPH-dependent 2,4-dienoyl-CoA reductase/sulfur reductase-like enzyme
VIQADLLVIGAGPAGASAALSASLLGLDVALVDEGAGAGGQVYRPSPASFRITDPERLGPDYRVGSWLRAELAASRVRTFFGRTVWLAKPGFRIDTFGPAGHEIFSSRALIVATGTHERVVPLPGWTLPGVIGLGAATTLLKSQHILPGRRVVVAGCGPLLGAVANAILKAGGSVVALVDLNGTGDLLRLTPQLLARPQLLAQGLGWMRRLRAVGTPIFQRHTVIEVCGTDAVKEVHLCPVDRQWRPLPARGITRLAADALAIGHGLVPMTEITRLLGARHEWRAGSGGWVASHDSGFRTSVPGVYVAGDAAGVAGAEAALLRGRVAGLAAAFDLGAVSRRRFDRAVGRLRRALRRAETFGQAMSRLMEVRAGLLTTMTPETVVCRCEDVTRREIEHALAHGARDVNQLKAWTRCGMGPCQGRLCGEVAARLVASVAGSLQRAGRWTARPPIRPVPLDQLTGTFAYTDLVLPPPAPP